MENSNCLGCGFICFSDIICSVIDCDKISKFFQSGRASGNDNHVLTEHSSNQCSDSMCVPYIDSRIIQVKMDIEGKCQIDGDNDVQRSKRTKDYSSKFSNPGNDLAQMNHQRSRQHYNLDDNQSNNDFQNMLRFLILLGLTAITIKHLKVLLVTLVSGT